MRRNAICLSKSLLGSALYSSLVASTWSSTLFIFIYTVCACVRVCVLCRLNASWHLVARCAVRSSSFSFSCSQ